VKMAQINNTKKPSNLMAQIIHIES
jgi:hypothetical protein